MNDPAEICSFRNKVTILERKRGEYTMKNTLSFLIGKGVSLENAVDRCYQRGFFKIIRNETLQIEQSYIDATVVISAFSVYIFTQPVLMSLWPLFRTTYCLVYDFLHLLFYFTAEFVNSVVCKAKSTARNPEYVHIQIVKTPAKLIIPFSRARACLLHRHQDRGCSDSAPNDNLFRRNLILFPASLRATQLL